MTQSLKVIIAGGGTGGHIYPALSIAEALKKINPKNEIIFVGTPQGLESKIVPKAGYSLKLIQSGQFNVQGQILKKIKTLIKLPIGIFQAFLILLKERPHLVLGVGGYASAPMLMAAILTFRKTALWEPNAHPGMANRVLSRWAQKAYVVFSEAQKYLKTNQVKVLGMPLREEIEQQIQKGDEQKFTQAQFTILCFGGSQGSVFLNEKLSNLILKKTEWQNKIKVIHQTGSRDFENIKSKYKNLSYVEVHEYIYNMPEYYKKADMLFCRGGASTLAEAAAFGVVPLVVPLPAADDHQQRNAEALVKIEAGFMLLQNQFDENLFENIIQKLIDEPATRLKMAVQLKNSAPKGAAKKIAEDICNTI